jgi:hypothetical protein
MSQSGRDKLAGTDSEANALSNKGVSDPIKMTIQQYHADNIDQETWDRCRHF